MSRIPEAQTTLMIAIAALLGEGWKLLPQDDDRMDDYAKLSNGKIELHMQDTDLRYARSTEKGKYDISYSYPKTYREHLGYIKDDDRAKSIMVTKTKTASQIAADIQRRLMPRIERFVALCEERIDRASQYSNTILSAGQQYETIGDPCVSVRYGKPDASGAINEAKLVTEFKRPSRIDGRIYADHLTVEGGSLTHPLALMMAKLMKLEADGRLGEVTLPK